MVQAVILSSFAVTCATLFLLLVPRPWRTHGPANRRDGLGGVREVRATPLPDPPPAGAAQTIPAAVAAPALRAEPVMPAVARSEPATPLMPLVKPEVKSPVKPPVQNGARNDGFARFARPNRARAAATGQTADTEPAGPAETRVAPTR
jgi:hypothetical protein